ncbi:alpha/beta hydrolase fold domain-containing protein [Streptomyces sp. NPDC001002]
MRRRLVTTLALASACLGVVASPTIAGAADSPSAAAADSGYTTYSNVSYASAQSQILDLYVPEGARKSMPVVVYVHGGGWGGGDKAELKTIPEWDSLLSHGFAVASVNYTLSGSAKSPTQVQEVKSAIRYLRANKSDYGLNGEVGLMGGSAGGQIVSVVGASCGVRSLEGSIGTTGPSSCVDAVVDLSGPTDFTKAAGYPALENTGAAYLGCPDGLASCTAKQLKQASPLTYVSSARKLPAFLIGHGDADTLIPLEQSQLLYSALKNVCADVTLHTLHGEGHFFPFTGGLSEPYPPQTVQTSKGCGKTGTSTGPALSLDTIGSFFRAHLR